MLKWLLLCFVASCSISTYAMKSASSCELALPTDDPSFCSSFKSVAACHCKEYGLPDGVCQNMNSIYKLMLVRHGTLQRACEYQKDTPTQDCIDAWNCYRMGGKDSQGRVCSSSEKVCE